MLIEKLNEIVESKDLQASGDKIKQDQRNKLRNDLLDLVAKTLNDKIENEYIQVGRVEKGVVITLDNEKVGIIPIMLDLKFMSLDYDLCDEMEFYQDKLNEKAKAEKEKAKAKAEKIKADTERREKMKALKESRNSWKIFNK